MRPIIALVLLVGTSAASVQQPLSAPSFQEAENDEYYQFDWPIQRVAIIGAGPGCVVCPIHCTMTHPWHLLVVA